MPQQGNPDQVAQGNRDSFSEGLGAIAEGILKNGENRREEQKLVQTQDNWNRQFVEQQKQRRIANEIQNRQLLEQKRMNDQAKALQDFNMQRQKDMMEFIKSRYGRMLGIGDDDPVKQEYDRLLAELKEQQWSNQAQMTMMGLNPQFMR